MNSVTGLPQSPSDSNVVWVAVDRWADIAHFCPTKLKTLDGLEKLYVKKANHVTRMVYQSDVLSYGYGRCITLDPGGDLFN